MLNLQSSAKNKKDNIFMGIFSLLLSASFIIGRKINLWVKPYFTYIQIVDIIYTLILGVVIFFLGIAALNFVCSKKIEFHEHKSNKKLWPIIFAVFIICWLPYLLSYYPGNLSPDSFSTVTQVIGMTKLNNHHPIMFTLFVKAFMKLGMLFGNINLGIACFSFAQMLVMAAILSYSVYWLYKKGVSKSIFIAVAIFFAINPLIAMYSITMWKDIMFGGFMLLFMLLLYDIIESKGELLVSKPGITALILSCFAVSFARNNGFYVIVATLIVLAVVYRKFYKILVPVFLSVIIVIFSIQGPLYKVFGIGESNFAESVGIPLQQIGYTISENGNISEEQKAYIDKLLPTETIREVYRPHSPDFIKFDKNFNNKLLNENKGEFIKNWTSIFFQNPIKYVKAWLMQTIGYYNIGTNNWKICFGIMEYKRDNSTGVYSTDIIKKLTGYPLATSLNQKIDGFLSLPIIEHIFNIAFMVWTTLFCCLVLIIKKNYKYIIPLVPLVVLWWTMMIAVPTFCEFRYMFAFHLAFPFVLMLMFISNKNNNSKSNVCD